MLDKFNVVQARLQALDAHVRAQHDRLSAQLPMPYSVQRNAEMLPLVLLRTKTIPEVEAEQRKAMIIGGHGDDESDTPSDARILQHDAKVATWIAHVQALAEILRTNRRYRFDDEDEMVGDGIGEGGEGTTTKEAGLSTARLSDWEEEAREQLACVERLLRFTASGRV